ncbi:developmentally-regulated protein, partial [Acrasis kona]
MFVSLSCVKSLFCDKCNCPLLSDIKVHDANLLHDCHYIKKLHIIMVIVEKEEQTSATKKTTSPLPSSHIVEIA